MEVNFKMALSHRADDDKHHDEPDNCAICHVVTSANQFCSNTKFQASR